MLRAKREHLTARACVLDAVRAHFSALDFLEVETPLRIPAPAPERYIDAEPSGDRFLITSPELQMKRLLQAGYPKIFQICHCFRKSERGNKHLPEFTMLEWYRLGEGVSSLMQDCEQLLRAAAKAIGRYPLFTFDGHAIDLSASFDVIEIQDAFVTLAGWRPGAHPEPDRFDRDLVDKVEPGLPRNRPVFLTGYPAAFASLARIDPACPERSERFELFAGGLELANGFGELTEAEEQRERFEAENDARRRDGKIGYPFDEHFLSALAAGLPPSAGIALGVDRLIMLLLDCDCIDDVVAFPEGTF
jgi:elongation factor P--(R)-beta-lysine ligase